MPLPTKTTTLLLVVLATCLALAGLSQPRDAGIGDAQRELAADDAANLLLDWLRSDGSPWTREPAIAREVGVLRQFYGDRSWRPAWVDAGRPTPQALEISQLLAAAADRGLRPGDYRAAIWTQRFQAVGLGDARALAQLDLELSAAVSHFTHDLRFGRIDPSTLGIETGADRDAGTLPAILAELASAPDVESTLRELVEPRHPAYAGLLAELQRLGAADDEPTRFEQVAHIELALERWRWLPRDLDGPAIFVNVPEFRLRAYGISGAPELEMKVVVGDARGSATPLFGSAMRTVVFQPQWYVPKSIVRGELVPSEEREPGYLEARGYDILDHHGRVSDSPMDEATLYGLRAGQLGLRQRSGPGNALGKVKFLFPNPYSVYLHDTPTRSAFERDRRDLSHGCVRVADPNALARWALRDVPGWTDDRVAKALAGYATLSVELPSPIRVVMVYHTTVVDENGVRFLPDLYGHDATLREAIAGLQAT
ncbi:MAG TPA: L,D-transpeptidase family protein [Thermoanaerobaculia bacterium]|nr:L,D-transpeptidase family protein [Thermoanaerobaculia bacterium]